MVRKETSMMLYIIQQQDIVISGEQRLVSIGILTKEPVIWIDVLGWLA